MKPIEIDQWQFDRSAANARKAVAIQNGSAARAMNEAGDELKTPALQGFAVRYRTLYETDAGLTVLTRGAFKKANARNVGIMIDHDLSTSLSNDGGLELIDTD